MAKRIAQHTGLTPTSTNDTANLVDSTYPMALQGGGSTQRFAIVEAATFGLAGSSGPADMMLAFDSQVATGSLTKDAGGASGTANLSDTVTDGSAGALSTAVSVFNKAATNKPQRDVAKHGPLLALNAFGGICRLNWPQDQQMVGVGNTASFGEISLSAFPGVTPGLLAAHIIFEPF